MCCARWPCEKRSPLPDSTVQAYKAWRSKVGCLLNDMRCAWHVVMPELSVRACEIWTLHP